MYIFAPVPGIAITVAKVPARIAANTVLAIKHMDQPGGLYDYWSGSPSPGGGGPGHSLTSTNTPPSLEEVGRMITGKSGSGKRCPTGMVWSPTHKKCILDITWGTDQYTRKSR